MFFNLRPDSLAFLALFLHSLNLLSLSANAAPLRVRQDNARSVTTVSTTNTPMGPLTETCVLVFTPIKDDQGRDAVREVKTCKLSMAGAAGSSSSTTATSVATSTSASSTTASSTSTSTSSSSATSAATSTTISSASTQTSSGAISVIGASTVTSSTAASTTSSTSPTATAAPDENATPAVSVVGTTSVPAPSAKQTDAIASSSAILGGPGSPPSEPTTSVQPTPSAAAAATASGSAAAAESPTAQAAVELPGKKLSVLPIGLGVFAGISVIALIVVGLVTYERTKYRKAFRQRKLAESGAAMGYGGMA